MQPFTLTPALKIEILRLAHQPDIHSISCPFDDFHLWEDLLREQIRRSKLTSLPPEEALFLAGPDSGIPGITPPRFIDDEDAAEPHPAEPDPRTGLLAPHAWGGTVHIPYEGASKILSSDRVKQPLPLAALDNQPKVASFAFAL